MRRPFGQSLSRAIRRRSADTASTASIGRMLTQVCRRLCIPVQKESTSETASAAGRREESVRART